MRKPDQYENTVQGKLRNYSSGTRNVRYKPGNKRIIRPIRRKIRRLLGSQIYDVRGAIIIGKWDIYMEINKAKLKLLEVVAEYLKHLKKWGPLFILHKK